MASFHDHSSAECGPGFRVCPPGSWATLLETHRNVLVTGPQRATEAFVRAAVARLRPPVHHVECESGLSLTPGPATLILRNVEALSDAHQQALTRWLDEEPNRGTQILSLSSAPLYTLVTAGLFGNALYYRLNVIHLQVAAE